MSRIELQTLPSLHSDHSLSPLPVLQSIHPALSTKEQVAAKRRNALGNVQFSALLWLMFTVGWNDGTTGPLILRLQEVYHVNFTIISLIFVFACIGFFSGAILNVFFGERFGFGKMMLFGACLHAAGHVIQSTAPPFPLFVAAFVLIGVGVAIEDAQANGFVASYKNNAEAKMGFLHAAYGAGALCSPLVATQFAEQPRWSFHYLISLGLSLLNILFIVVVFKLKTQDECFKAIGQEPGEKSATGHSPMKQILSIKTVHLLAFFILIYVGAEVTIGGWIVTFVRQLRGGGPSSGYISSGFFGGLMLGRVILLPVNKLVGEHNAIYLYTLLALGLEFVVWFVPSLIGGGVAVSIVGMFLGPIYPIVMNYCSRALPKWVLTGSIGWIAGFGQAGSAVLPFVTGVMAEKYGIGSLQPLMVAMMATLLCLWTVVRIFGKKQRED